MNDEHQADMVVGSNAARPREAVPGTSTTEGFGTTTSSALAETSSSAAAAQAQAATQARYIMAMQRPRDWDNVRLLVLKECKRPRFAAVARYRKPIGKGVEGFSIRFAEAALRSMTNVLPEVVTVYDDAKKRIVRVSVTDLEANVTYSGDVTIDKVVERSRPKDGVPPISVRTNSYGKKVYLVEAEEDDLLNKQGALVSKALRTHALRLIPGDILDEAMDQILETQRNEDARDPSAARKKLVDAFFEMGVKPSELKDYLGHDLDGASPAEIGELRAVYVSIRDGEASWKDSLEHKKKGATAGEDKPTTSVKDKVAAKAKEAKAKDVTPPPSAPRQHDPATGEVAPEDELQTREPGED